MKLGYVGVGNMGAAIARRLLREYDLKVFDTNPAAMAALEGAQPSQSAAALAAECDIVFTCLPASSDVRAAFFGPGGIAEGLAAGGLIVDMTTGDPTQTHAMAAELAERGLHLIDAPVSGGPKGAEAGTIAIMVGGPEDLFERARPALTTVSPNVVHMGGVGAGHVMKAANNMLNAICRLGTFEAVSLATKAGVDPKLCVEVLQKSSGRNYATEVSFPRDVLTGQLKQGFTLGLMHKDVTVATSLGLDVAVPLALGNAARETFQAAKNEFGADADVNAVAYAYERATGAKLLPEG